MNQRKNSKTATEKDFGTLVTQEKLICELRHRPVGANFFPCLH